MTTISKAVAAEIRTKAYSIEKNYSREYAAFETPEQLAEVLGIEVPAGVTDLALIDLLLKNKDHNIVLLQFKTRDGQSEKYTGGTCDSLYTAFDVEQQHGKNSTASYTKDSLPELQQQLAEECEDGDGSNSPAADRLRELIEQVEKLEDGQTAIYWPGTPTDSPDVYHAQFEAYRHDVYYYRLLCAVEIEEEDEEWDEEAEQA